jgi:hypothetical protein
MEKAANNVPAQQDRKIQLSADGEGTLKSVGGSRFDEFVNVCVADAIGNSQWLKHKSPERQAEITQAALCGVVGIAPRDEIEGLLATHMMMVHAASTECYRRAMLPEQPVEGRRSNLLLANKLTRTMTVLVESLARHRGKGAQTVVVKHVTVNADQAVVADTVTTGGGTAKIGDQPHAKQLADASKSALPSTVEAIRDAVPISGG